MHLPESSAHISMSGVENLQVQLCPIHLKSNTEMYSFMYFIGTSAFFHSGFFKTWIVSRLTFLLLLVCS
jgi:hypothetical protein